MLAIDDLVNNLTINIKQHKFNIKDILNLEKGFKKINSIKETINKIYFKNKYNITFEDNNIVKVFGKSKEPFIESLLNIMYIGFYKLLENEKMNKIIEFKRKLGFALNDYIKQNIHEYFLKKYKRLEIQKQLLTENNKFENYTKPTNELLNYIADYFDINIYIFEISENNTIDNIIGVLSKKKIIDWKKPTIFINKEIKYDKYISLIDRENKYIINEKYNEILEKLYEITLDEKYKNLLNKEEIEYEYNEDEENEINNKINIENEDINIEHNNEIEVNKDNKDNKDTENEEDKDIENEEETEIENEKGIKNEEEREIENEEEKEIENEEEREIEDNDENDKEKKNMKNNEIIKKLNNMKLVELVEECKKYNISELKESEKTKKMIKKTKNELINEILIILN
jgi:hypothetical protein